MGLDIVEIVLTVEERFGILMPDSDMPQIETVGEFYTYILNALARQNTEQVCLTSATFYQLRRGLVELGIARTEIRPTTSLTALLPARTRRIKWKKLGQRTGKRLPVLTTPLEVKVVIAATGVAMAAWLRKGISAS